MFLKLGSLIHFLLSFFFSLCFAFLSSLLATLQTKGDLDAYREVYNIATSSSNFLEFYVTANAYENVRDVLYAFIVYISALFVDFDSYIFLSSFVLGFLVFYLIFSVGNYSMSFMLSCLTFSSLYPWALATNLDKAKIAIIFYLLAVICNLSSRRHWIVVALFIASVMSHFSCIIPVFLFYLFYSSSYCGYRHSARSIIYAGDQYIYEQRPLFSWENVENKFFNLLALTKIIKLSHFLYLLVMILIGILSVHSLPRIIYYFQKSQIEIKDFVQALYLSLLGSSLLAKPSFNKKLLDRKANTLIFSINNLKAFLFLYVLFAFLSLLVGLFRFNILIFLWLLCASVFNSQNRPVVATQGVILLIPFCLISIASLLAYVQNSLLNGNGFYA